MAHTLQYNLPNCSDSETEYSTDSCQSTSDSSHSGEIIENKNVKIQNQKNIADNYRRYSNISEHSISAEDKYRDEFESNILSFNDQTNQNILELHNELIIRPSDTNFLENNCTSNNVSLDESWTNTVVHMNENTEQCSNSSGQPIDVCQSDCSSCCDSNCCSSCNGCLSCQSENSSLCEQPPEYGILHNDVDTGKCSSEVNDDKIFTNNNNIYCEKEDISEPAPNNDRSNETHNVSWHYC